MKIIKYLFIIIIMISTSCSDFLEKEPLTVLSPDSFWKTKDDMKLALNKLYKKMNVSYKDNRSLDTFGGAPDDISSGTYNPKNTDATWNSCYESIRICNDFLENYETVQETPDVKNRFVGEARFFRAYYYYQLVTRFGAVPLITKTLDMDSPELYSARANVDDVWNLIFEDLQFAVTNIPPKSKIKKELGRITQGAAYSFMARAALYVGTHNKFHRGNDYGKYLTMARDASKAVIDSKEYSLYSDFRNLFLNIGMDSSEDVLSYRYSEEEGTMNFRPRYAIYDFDCEPTKYAADNFLCKDGLPIDKSAYKVEYLPIGKEFENRDPRMALTIWKPGDDYEGAPFLPNFHSQTLSGYIFKKYGIEKAFTFDPEVMYTNDMLIRYAEVLLIYAESCYELNDQISDEDLNISINSLRDRFIGNPNKLPHLTNAFCNEHSLSMREEIRRERRAELTGEGFRYDDLIRWKTAENELPKAILGVKFDAKAYPDIIPGKDIALDDNGFVIVQPSSKRSFDPERDYLYPLPLREISLNPQLKQNPGW